MNRKLKTTITISAVIAGSILMVNAQGAKADDVNKTSSPQEAGLITKTKEGTVKKADVDKAKEEYETKIRAMEAPAELEKPIILSGKHVFETQLQHVLSGLDSK